ncbi:hypothetical protein KC19_3G077000, partial [Ceratodon purpureus]
VCTFKKLRSFFEDHCSDQRLDADCINWLFGLPHLLQDCAVRFIFSTFGFNNTISAFFGLTSGCFKTSLPGLERSSSNHVWSKFVNSFSISTTISFLIMGVKAQLTICCLGAITTLSLVHLHTTKTKYIQLCKWKR